MVVCPNCNKELPEGTKFCTGCGTKICDKVYCPNCGELTSEKFAFCQHCGASMDEVLPVEKPPVVVPPKEKKFPKKALLFGGIGVAVVAVLILAISLFAGGKAPKGKNNFALYVKDKEIYFSDLKKNSEAWQVTSRLDAADALDNRDFYANYEINEYTYVTEDGKYIFYIDKLDYDENGVNLYYRELAKPDAEAIKIDSDVQIYTVNKSATLVTYLKGEEGNLYQYKIGEESKEKIASDIYSFKVSENGKKVVYMDSDDRLYRQEVGGEKEKLASDVYDIEYVTDDLSTVYYTKDDALYQQTEGKDKVKIASDIAYVIEIYESGEIYYVTGESVESAMMDYVEEDLAVPAVAEPDWRDYETDDDYYAAYDEYLEIQEQEEQLQYLKAYLEEETMYLTRSSLCYYDGEDTTVITEEFFTADYIWATDAPVMVYKAYNPDNFKKVKLSELIEEDEYDYYDVIDAARQAACEQFITVKGAATRLETEKEAKNIRVNDSGTVVYYVDNVAEGKNYGDLYRISVSNNGPGKAEVYDSDVSVYGGYFLDDTQYLYFKDYKNSVADMYINKKKVDNDTSTYSTNWQPDMGKLFYYTDTDNDKHSGKLTVYDGKESVVIADDVFHYQITPDGHVLYLCDYSVERWKGDLKVWFKGETSKIDDDVIWFVSIYDSKYRGSIFGW